MLEKDAQFWNDEGIIQYKSGNYLKAKEFWTIAAKRGNKNAMYELGMMSLSESNDLNTLTISREWFMCAYKNGHKNAIEALNEIDNAIKQSDYSLIKIPEIFLMNNKKNTFTDYKTVNFGGIQWLILKENADASLCFSVNIIDVMRYHELLEDVTWESCSLRKWLNKDFLSSFSSKVKCKIVSVKIDNPCNPIYGTYGGNSTFDKVFLLSLEELSNFFNFKLDSNDSRNTTTEVENSAKLKAFLNIKANELRRIKKESGHDLSEINGSSLGWWLRSPGINLRNAMRVNCHGKVRVYGRNVNRDLVGVRPAMWIKKEVYS